MQVGRRAEPAQARLVGRVAGVEVEHDVRLGERPRPLDELVGHGAEPVEPRRRRRRPSIASQPCSTYRSRWASLSTPPSCRAAGQPAARRVAERLEVGVVDRADGVHDRPVAVEEPHPGLLHQSRPVLLGREDEIPAIDRAEQLGGVEAEPGREHEHTLARHADERARARDRDRRGLLAPLLVAELEHRADGDAERRVTRGAPVLGHLDPDAGEELLTGPEGRRRRAAGGRPAASRSSRRSSAALRGSLERVCHDAAVPEMLEAEAARALIAEQALDREIAKVHAPDAWFLKRGLTPRAVRAALPGLHLAQARRRGKLLLRRHRIGPTVSTAPCSGCTSG